MAHLFNVVVYDSFNRKNVKISTTYYFLDFSFFMSQDDAHYQNHLNAPIVLKCMFAFLTKNICHVIDSICILMREELMKLVPGKFIGAK